MSESPMGNTETLPRASQKARIYIKKLMKRQGFSAAEIMEALN